MNILIRYLAMHDDLSDQSKKLWEDYALKHGINVEFVPSADYAFLAQYDSFTVPIHKADIVIQMDEDCFLMHPEKIIPMAKYMVKNSIAYAGMREIDSNIRKDVQGIKDYYINSFFMMIQPSCIGEIITPQELLNFEPSDGKWLEPYWNIIGYMHQRGFKCEYFPVKTHTDGISTVLCDFQGNPFAIHTWFARLWDCSESLAIEEGVPNNRQRIEDAYKFAAKRNVWLSK
jgi:hypothetical protein